MGTKLKIASYIPNEEKEACTKSNRQLGEKTTLLKKIVQVSKYRSILLDLPLKS